MTWLKALVAGLMLAREVVKYLNQREQNKAAAVKRVQELKGHVRTARKTGDSVPFASTIAKVGLGGKPK